MSARLRALIAAAISAMLATVLTAGLATSAHAAATVVNDAWRVGPPTQAYFPDGNTADVTTTGAMSIFGSSLLGVSPDVAPLDAFSPEVTVRTKVIQFLHNGTGCAVSGLCDPSVGVGTITITFAIPVVNPVLHFTGLSDWTTSGKFNGDASTRSEVLTLSSSAPAGVTIGAPLATPRSVYTTSNTITALPAGSTGTPSMDCSESFSASGGVNVEVAPKYYAGCGSVPIIGTVSSLTFDANLYYVIAAGIGYNGVTSTWWGNVPGNIFSLAISYEQTTTIAVPAPALSLAKSVSPTTVTAAGQDVLYSFLVTNTGNTSISGVGINELAFSGTGTMGTLTCPDTTLAAGASTTCTAPYQVTQADVDAGTVTNNAQATGTSDGGTAVTSNESPATITATQTSALTLVKTVTAPDSVVGATATYTFEVTNTGNTTLTGIAINETAFTGTGTLSAIDCPTTPLLPTKSLTCTATYAVTAADITAGTVTNTAVATGNTPTKATVTSAPDDASFPLVAPLGPTTTPTPTATATATATESATSTATALAHTGSEPMPLVLFALMLIGLGTASLALTTPRRLRRH